MKFFSDPAQLLKETSIVDKFIEYIKIDTTADDHCEECPSTLGQFVLARKLVAELKDLGLDDAKVNNDCYVTATLPGNINGGKPIGLIAHLDTSPAVSGTDIKPIFHENYDGSDIKLANNVVIAAKDNPELKRCIGDTIITADGTTLLGADDKAGVAAIMAILEYYKKNPSLPRPSIRVGFTPDEEIGRGSAKFPIEEFGADVAFTVDGSFDGDINIETFHADSAFVTVTGVSTHPGMAKGKLVNALRYMSKFIDHLPAEISPECTEGREGFIHPYEISGDASCCKCQLILRDFEPEKTTGWGDLVKETAAAVAKEEPRLKIDVEIKHSYPNMFQFLKDRPEIAERLTEAVRRAGIEPKMTPIRGGTDGANLSRMGLPCPNIFGGGVNFHGETEWISTRSMGLVVCTLLNLMTLYSS
jgi:tripeptide aminopeptidase